MDTNRKPTGRPPKAGEPAKTRAIRMTDADWADVLLVGLDRLRALVRKEAAKIRKKGTE